jgi:U3 small nucleolar RNA-associated protein 3
MGKGRRRNTAKTGDKALYAKRSNQEGSKGRSKDEDAMDADDDMYDRVDRYHNRLEQDFLRLDGKEGEDSDDDDNDDGNYNNVLPVMNLGIGASDDDEDDEDSDDESSGDEAEHRDSSKGYAKRAHADDDSDDDDDDDDAATSDDGEEDEEEEEPEDVRDWGKRKSSYYHGDTADLEIGQDQDDAFLEEEAAKEIHKARMTNLAEEDFEIDDDDVEEGAGKHGQDGAAAASRSNVHRLTRREKRKIIERQSPEFFPLVEHFTGVVRELHDRTNVAVQALFEGEEGAAQVR